MCACMLHASQSYPTCFVDFLDVRLEGLWASGGSLNRLFLDGPLADI
jgi:hypothetical protein